MFFQMAPKGPSWRGMFVFSTGGEVLRQKKSQLTSEGEICG
jgi:hypothetical protein